MRLPSGVNCGAKLAQLVEGVGFLPEVEDVLFEGNEIYFVGYVFKAHGISLLVV